MKIMCTHIADHLQRRTLWAYFTCEFEDVVHFSVETLRDSWRQPDRPKDSQYLFSEIDSLTDLTQHYSKIHRRKYRSLIIELDPPAFMSLVFRDVYVEAAEPLAFELIQKDLNFDTWLYPFDE
jgi:hypothetical protein